MKLKYWMFLLFPAFACANDNQVPDLPPKNATRSARTCPELNGAYVTGDFIYWKARQDNLFIAAEIDATITQTTQDLGIKVYEIDFEYKPGFRIGVGGDLPWNGWDIYLNWTRLSFDLSSSKTSDDFNLGLLDGSLEGTVFFGRQAQVHWDFTYNSLEFDWGRRFFLDSSWIVRPSFGLKTVWFDEKINVALDEVESFSPGFAGIPGENEYRRSKFDIWGIGPLATFYGKWNWIYGLGIAGQVSGSILWYSTDHNIRALQNELSGGQPPSARQTITHGSYTTHRVRPYVQAFIGLDWEWCFIPKWLSIQLAIGYETQYFWAMIVDPVGSADDVPISIEGLTFKARLDF